MRRSRSRLRYVSLNRQRVRRSLTRFAIRNPIIIAVCLIATFCIGIVSLFVLPRSQNPNVQLPVITVTVSDPGASAQDVDRLLVRPIEEQLANVEGLALLSATSQPGNAVMTVALKLNVDVDFAVLDVQRRVDAARQNLPIDLAPPVIAKVVIGDPVITIAVSSRSTSLGALSEIVANDVVPTLDAVGGVERASARGDVSREIRVEANPQALRAARLSLTDLADAARASNDLFPGDRFDAAGLERPATVRGDLRNAEDLASTAIVGVASSSPADNARSVQIRDVARVVDGYFEPRIIGRYNGVPAVFIDIRRTRSADEVGTAERVREALYDLARRYPKLHFDEADNSTDYTSAAVMGVFMNLIEGIALTAIVMLIFLQAWRDAAVVLVAIPTSLLATLGMMHLLGLRLDTLSISALALTVGILVDDSIVVLENIRRHRDMGKSPLEAAIAGRSEIAGAAVALTLVDVVVFVPIAFTGGIPGEFLREFGLVIAFATLFSLLVSFTVTPLLAARFPTAKHVGLRRGVFSRSEEVLQSIRDGYVDRVLAFAIRRSWVTVAVSFVLVIAAGAVAPFVGSDFLPGRHTGAVLATMTYPVHTAIGTTDASVRVLDAAIARLDGVRSVASIVGSQSGDDIDVEGSNRAEIRIRLQPERRTDDVRLASDVERLQALVRGARLLVAPITGAGSGGDPISYSVAGPANSVESTARALAFRIAAIPGTVNVRTSLDNAESDGVELRADRGRETVLGVDPAVANEVARLATGGELVTRFRSEQRLVDVRVGLSRADRRDPTLLDRLDIRSSRGLLVPASEIVDASAHVEATVVERESRHRIVRVVGALRPDVPLGNIDTIVQTFARTLPSGVSISAEGDSKNLGDTLTSLGLAVGSSVLFAYLLMVVLYRSFRLPLVVVSSMPVTLVGAVPALVLTHQTINLFSIIGLILAFGIAAKNAILLLDYAEQRRRRGVDARAAIIEAARIRFRPIVMTTAALVLGTLPLALGFAEGAEQRRSTGVTVIGGVLGSLLLTLVLIPAIYSLTHRAESSAREGTRRDVARLEISPS